MQPEVELFFCDLCNTSVPEADLAGGRARRAGDKLVGACCISQLAPDAKAAEPAPGRPVSGTMVGATILLLAAVAAGTMFLDWRMAEERGWFDDRLHGVETAAGGQSERLAALELAVERVATRTDLARLSEGTQSFSARVEEMGGSLERVIGGVERQSTQLTERIERLQASAQEQALRLGTIEGELARLAGEVAAAKAQPRAVPSDFDAAATEPRAEPAPMEPAVPAMPPALAHEVSRLADTDPGVRFDAVDKLLQSKNLQVLPALLGALRDPDLFVRRYVADGLVAFRHVDAVDALIEVLADPETIVRDTAYGTLKTLTGQKIPFESDGSRAQIAAAQRRWQDWWKTARGTF